MQMTHHFEPQSNGDCLIWVCEGHGSSPVVRTTDGVFTCHAPQCVWKKNNWNCEHVLFAVEKYDSDIKPNEEWKLEQEKQRMLTKMKLLEEQLAALKAVGQPVEEKTALATFDLPRRILVDD